LIDFFIHVFGPNTKALFSLLQTDCLRKKREGRKKKVRKRKRKKKRGWNLTLYPMGANVSVAQEKITDTVNMSMDSSCTATSDVNQTMQNVNITVKNCGFVPNIDLTQDSSSSVTCDISDEIKELAKLATSATTKQKVSLGLSANVADTNEDIEHDVTETLTAACNASSSTNQTMGGKDEPIDLTIDCGDPPSFLDRLTGKQPTSLWTEKSAKQAIKLTQKANPKVNCLLKQVAKASDTLTAKAKTKQTVKSIGSIFADILGGMLLGPLMIILGPILIIIVIVVLFKVISSGGGGGGGGGHHEGGGMMEYAMGEGGGGFFGLGGGDEKGGGGFFGLGGGGDEEGGGGGGVMGHLMDGMGGGMFGHHNGHYGTHNHRHHEHEYHSPPPVHHSGSHTHNHFHMGGCGGGGGGRRGGGNFSSDGWDSYSDEQDSDEKPKKRKRVKRRRGGGGDGEGGNGGDGDGQSWMQKLENAGEEALDETKQVAEAAGRGLEEVGEGAANLAKEGAEAA